MAKFSTTQRASIAALSRSATEDTVAMTAKARSTFEQTHIDRAWESIGPFEEALVADYPGVPAEVLYPQIEAEVLRRAEALRKLHYARLSAAGVAGRKKGRAAK